MEIGVRGMRLTKTVARDAAALALMLALAGANASLAGDVSAQPASTLDVTSSTAGGNAAANLGGGLVEQFSRVGVREPGLQHVAESCGVEAIHAQPQQSGDLADLAAGPRELVLFTNRPTRSTAPIIYTPAVRQFSQVPKRGFRPPHSLAARRSRRPR